MSIEFCADLQFIGTFEQNQEKSQWRNALVTIGTWDLSPPQIIQYKMCATLYSDSKKNKTKTV